MKKITALILALVLALGAAAFADTLPAFKPEAGEPDDPGYAIDLLLSDVERAKEDFSYEDGNVVIPAAIIYKITVLKGETSTYKVYGTFCTDIYRVNGDVLERLAGITRQGMITLELSKDGKWTVIGEEYAQDETFEADQERIAGGSADLLARFRDREKNERSYAAVRKANIRQYVQDNGLGITAYQDYGWDPVPLDP